MIEQLIAAVDSMLPEPLSREQRIRLATQFRMVTDPILRQSPTEQVCAAIDQLKQRGIGVTAVKCGGLGLGLELALYQLHTPGKATVEETPGDEDPIFDAVR